MTKFAALILLITLSVNTIANDKKDVSSTNNAETSVELLSFISRKVVDSITGEPLAGVTISLEGNDVVAFSDFDGTFRFSNINIKTCNHLNASFISYEKASVEISTVKSEIVVSLKSLF